MGKAALFSLCELPHRQLRNYFLLGIVYLYGELPHRQLRKLTITKRFLCFRELPHR